MRSRYDVNYQLRSHKRDQFIEFIKTLLLTPFLTGTCDAAADGDNAPTNMRMTVPTTTAPVKEPPVPHVVLPPLRTADRHGGRSRAAERYMDVLGHLETLIDQHREHWHEGTSEHSRLSAYVPSIGAFFTRLPLRDAFRLQDEQLRISARQFVPPSFNDVRRVLNTAQVMALVGGLRLITFDGDVTLYEDGADLEPSSPIAALLLRLLACDLHVAIVTAAGYADRERFEQRLQGLLIAFAEYNLPEETVARFHVVGGECNFLLRAQREDGRWRLAFQPFQPEALSGFHEKDVADFLDVAESSLRDCILSMNLRATVLRKQRAVGLIPAAKAIPMLVESRAPSPTADRDPLSSTPNNSSAPTYGRASASFDGMQKPLPPVSYKMGREQLDECVIRTQNALRLMYARRAIPTPPHCVFNGGRDVWVDIGNKQLGVQALQSLLQTAPDQTVHVGDQFLSTGNDIATRSTCCTLWVVDPQETVNVLDELLLGMSSA